MDYLMILCIGFIFAYLSLSLAEIIWIFVNGYNPPLNDFLRKFYESINFSGKIYLGINILRLIYEYLEKT